MRRLLLLLSLSGLSWGAELLNVTGKVMVVDFTSKRVELDVPAYKGIAAETRVCLQGRTNVKQTMDLKCGKIPYIE